MPWFTHPTSFRLASAASESIQKRFVAGATEVSMMAQDGMFDAMKNKLPPHSSHPDFGHLVLLVFEAVLEVVCVALPGYIVARRGMFDADAQKMVANLNVQLFTPCLVFTKLASQLNADKLAELAVIPFIFIAQTIVSFLCAKAISYAFRFKKRQSNFVIAMGVFGNSNSLPISLVISLSKTLKGLHWDKIPGDNDDEVAARGILYLLIFQQLGQLVRWTWGYNVLLAPASQYHEDEQDGAENHLIEEGRYTDDPEDDRAKKPNGRNADSDYGSGSHTPSTISTLDDTPRQNTDVLPTPANGNIVGSGPGNMAGNLGDRQRSTGHITTFPTYSSVSQRSSGEDEPGVKGIYFRCRSRTQLAWYRFCSTISTFFRNLFRRLPTGVQSVLSKISFYVMKFLRGLWEFMNPPLWAMLIAIIVASIPKLQHLFFDKGTFISNSVTRAVSQSGGVAVPLILVVLGANLARNTLPAEDVNPSPEAKKEERNLLIASLVSRMLLPTVIMAPILALIAKYVPVSILDDPIFVIVCFLLTGAPSALQLAQICQINNVFMGAMSRLLFQSYVIWILPSTLMLVMLALEVVEWAAAA